ncbi:chemotaxis protein CheB [uncultured Endozoicomonas sp.]|uniref:chemotaxis protein CheB n=1 Tax=uncultured Endozoicomonas sp. TaxID=432652 RepID=UPI0026188ED8|nr:chemotaxis protein CheB [uncultured Endozoicomonas sp.]
MRGKYSGNGGKAIVIGASAGGINALGFLFSELEEDFPFPLLVTKHVGAKDDGGALRVLARQSSLPVRLARDKDAIMAGTILLAPAGYHMQVEESGVISLNMEPPVAFVRPSIDVLFQSAARVYEHALVAIVLTGANSDGADGIRAVKDFGGTTVVQCPDSSMISTMPQASLGTGCVDYQLPLEEIPAFLDQL